MKLSKSRFSHGGWAWSERAMLLKYEVLPGDTVPGGSRQQRQGYLGDDALCSS